MKKAFLFLLSGFLCGAVSADPIWIDVRGADEHAADHIEGDVHVPLATLDADALAATYGKDAELMLYCRSGNRAGQAQEILKAAGFTNVTNAGGIGEVRTLRDLAGQESDLPAEAQAAPAR